MSLLNAVVLGVVEGLTEFLPVSSTGHLILASDLLGIAQTGFVKTFEIAIQLGAILAVVAIYWRRFLLEPEVMKRIAAAFLPTAAVGFALYPFIKRLFESEMTVVATLFLGGVAILLFERWYGKRGVLGESNLTKMTYRQAVLVGLSQAVAVIPGVSRSGATILGGLSLGFSRAAITEFSFLLAAPTMAAATGYDLLKNYGSFQASELPVFLVGFVVSFVVAILAVTSFLRFVRTHSFVAFGWYRIVAAALFYLLAIR
ncbi:MAG: undecaprenyl-diphosphate phosphatase [Candidatus Moranbacteria bacterium]|nr:undecaprenyl-diphosphate phosphatase [Candidatus Moranbacteria bacterium]